MKANRPRREMLDLASVLKTAAINAYEAGAEDYYRTLTADATRLLLMAVRDYMSIAQGAGNLNNENMFVEVIDKILEEPIPF